MKEKLANESYACHNKLEFNPGSEWTLGVCLIHASLFK